MAEPATVININMDKACNACGKPGAGDGGLCISCALSPIVGEQTERMILTQITELLETYNDKINRAIKLSGNDLFVTFTVNMTASQNRQVFVSTGIGFISEKIKDRTEVATVDEIQGDMFEGQL
ncbi:MAG: hypothetical protein WCK00_15045 [Deltaproteobacteria bacterium]